MIRLRRGARLEKPFGRIVAFRQIPPPVACYDGTMLPDEINRQCTPAQLRVKPRSTGKLMKINYLATLTTRKPSQLRLEKALGNAGERCAAWYGLKNLLEQR
jgi:hypothetical protein